MSKYGDVHDIFNQHHIQTKEKLDEILAKNSEIDLNSDQLEAKIDISNASLSSMDSKLVTCDTGSVVVSSSALPTGAASESSLAALNAKITACDTSSVSVASSALPSGAASESSLAALNGEVTSCDTSNVVVSSSVLPSGAASESSLAALNAKITACDTSSVSVASSALPSGASESAKQDEIKVLIGNTNSALAGTLSVSAPAISKSSSTPVNAESINGQSTYLSSEFDVGAFKHLSLIGSSSDIVNSHEVDLLVSNSSGGTFFKTSHSGYFFEGSYHVLVSNHPYKFVKVSIKNGDIAVGMAATFTMHSLSSD